MEPIRKDFWDHLSALRNKAEWECAEKVKEGNLDDFQKGFDPTARLEERSWFVEAKPAVKEFAVRSLRNEIKKIVEYYRAAEALLGGESGGRL